MSNYKNNQSVLVVISAENTERVLMLQRQDDPDFWQSVTGSIEQGESPFHTAVREVNEETGIDIIAQNLFLYDSKYCVEFEIFSQFRYKYAPHIRHCTEHWFWLALPFEQTPKLAEHLAFSWLPVSEAIALTKSPNNAQAIARFCLHNDLVTAQ